MRHNELTEVERRVVKAWKAAGLTVPTDPATVRSMTRRTAYHEAGHVAARMFTGQEAGHILHVSIIPEGESDGYERSERNFVEFMIEAYPPQMKRGAGRCLLLALLAGRGAEARVATSEDREDIIDLENEEWEIEGTDLFRAWRVAGILKRPRANTWRVLALAEKWTIEMLELPAVWQSVERLAGMLLERGTIEDRDEIMTVCDDILFMGLLLPRWKRRFALTKAEAKAMGYRVDRMPKWKPAEEEGDTGIG